MRGLIARPAGLSAENLLVSFVSLLRIIYSSDFQDAKDSREGHFFNTIGAKRTKVSLDEITAAHGSAAQKRHKCLPAFMGWGGG